MARSIDDVPLDERQTVALERIADLLDQLVSETAAGLATLADAVDTIEVETNDD